MDNSPKIATSARSMALKLAQLGESFDAAALSSYAGCSHVTALTVLGKLAADGALHRVAHGWYALEPRRDHDVDKGRPVNGMCALARAERAHKAGELAEVEAFLSSREQWPGCTTPLPSAQSRPPVFHERGSRRLA